MKNVYLHTVVHGIHVILPTDNMLHKIQYFSKIGRYKKYTGKIKCNFGSVKTCY